jgi:hypothetical protein
MLRMRTTNKLFKDQVQNHIKNGLLDEQGLKSGYGIETNEDNLLKNQLSIVSKEFNSWYGRHEQKMHPNRQEAFTNWLDGLPSCMSTEFEYHNVHKTMKNWFENTGMDYKHNDPNTDEYVLYKNLVYRELKTLANKNNINL